MRILLIRTSALGDVVHCLPVLAALRRQIPTARLGWVVEAAMAPLLDGHPDLDDLLEVELRTWRRRPLARSTVAGVRRFLGELRAFAPEVVIDLMGNHKAGVLGGLTLADRRIGARASDRREPSSAAWISEPVAVRGTHVVERALSLLAPLGIEPSEVDFGGDKLFPRVEPPPGLPESFYLLHPGAAWPNKRYPPALWGEVALRLSTETGLEGVAVAGPGEGPLAGEAIAASGGALIPAPTEGLADLATVARRSELMLGADSGPLHLAHALGVPVLAVMGPTDPRTHGPYGRPENAVFHRLPCSFCHRRFDEPKACLELLAPGRIVERATALLGM